MAQRNKETASPAARDYRLPIPIILAGEPVPADTVVSLRPDEIVRVEQAARAAGVPLIQDEPDSTAPAGVESN